MQGSRTSKAIAGAIVGLLVVLLTKYGIVLDADTSAAVSVLLDVIIAAIIGYVGVYIAPKNRE